MFNAEGIWATSLEAAIANTRRTSTEARDHLNSELTKRYNSQFDSWKVMVEAGKIDNLNPPKPPKGFALVETEHGFVYPEPSNTPVCPERTDIPADNSKPIVQVIPEPTHIRNVPKGDTLPVGFTFDAPDGSRWQKQSSVTPFGVAYFYFKVS